MSNAQNSLLASGTGPDRPEPMQDAPPVSATMAHGEVRTDDGADLGGHTLLSRPPVPQGRRSLFRR